MAEDGQVARIELNDGTDWQFNDWPAVLRWFADVEKFWRPFEAAEIASDPSNFRANLIGRLNSLRDALRQWSSSGQPVADFAPAIASACNDTYAPAHPDSALGQAIGDIRESIGSEAAIFALALVRGIGTPIQAQNLTHFKGMVAIAIPGIASLSAGAKRLAEERSSFRSATRRISDEIEQKESDRDAHWARLLAEADARSRKVARGRLRGWRALIERWRKQKTEAIDQLKATEAAYREFMALRAPVEYWTTKAGKHQKAEFRSGIYVLAFFVISIPTLAGIFLFAGWYLLNKVTGTPPPGFYVIASAGLATTAGLMFWVGRLLTKLYLSQHHLRQDAEERAVMTTTYLALIADGAASEADRGVILGALFRSTSDGIVKEDGGLDPNVASLLSKLAVR